GGVRTLKHALGARAHPIVVDFAIRVQRFSCSLPRRSSSGGRGTTRRPFADSAEQRRGMKPMRNHLRSMIGAGMMLVASLAASQQSPAQPPDAGTLAFTGVRLIDGSGSDPIESAVLVVENGRIRSEEHTSELQSREK